MLLCVLEESIRQTLILITGSPCVGETAAAESLLEAYENSAYFDGDWAWCVHPFSLDDPRLRNGDRTMSFALSNYLNSGFEYVIFSSVVIIGEQIRAAIIKDITAKGFKTAAFTLKCSEKTLTDRRKKRGDPGEISFQWLRMAVHPGDYVINTDGKTAEQVAAGIKAILDAEEEQERGAPYGSETEAVRV